jgi:prophage antirepressor-like protein
MQYHLQVFEYEDHRQFRIIDRDGEPWFVLVDACRALDIKNPSDAASRLDADEKMTLALTEGQSGSRGGARSMNVISESGLYSLILRSDKPEAKRFKKWVTAEVLPTIRRTGGYGHRPQLPAFIRRFNENWDRVDVGHFSILSEVMARIYGRFEMAGHLLADRSPSGTENRMDGSVGRRFSEWLKAKHPNVADNYSFYVHKTPDWEGPVRQYPNQMLPLFIEFVETIWIPKCGERYFSPRDPAALPYLHKIIPALDRPKAGMIRLPNARRRL